LAIHNHVYSFGEWGWIIGSKNLTSKEIKEELKATSFEDVETKWMSPDAIQLMISFGKDLQNADSVEVNTIHNPVLYRYYLDGAWARYL
jgi:spermidine synthase